MKQSLWDLKLVKYKKIVDVNEILKQSLWDLKLDHTKMENKIDDFEAVPMGFETRYRYREGRDRGYFEAVPMGFET